MNTLNHLDIPNVTGIERIEFKTTEQAERFSKSFDKLVRTEMLVQDILHGANPALAERGIGIKAPKLVVDFLKKELEKRGL